MEEIRLPFRRKAALAATPLKAANAATSATPVIPAFTDIRCMSRMAPFPHFEYFANKKNRFYMEMRCEKTRIQGSEFCEACQHKDPDYHYPSSRRFDHGKINEPIPDRSHIFGGSWYDAQVKRWGEPSSDVIADALNHQKEARAGYKVEEPSSLSIPSQPAMSSLPKKRGGRKKATTAETPKELPLILQSDPPTEKTSLTIDTMLTPPSTPSASATAASAASTAPKKRKPAAKPKAKPVQPPIAAPPVPDTIQPTHKEVEMEEVVMADYDVVRVRVIPFRDSMWLEDTKKKVYRRTGEYVGRYDPMADRIDEEVPDSDEE